MLATLLDKDLIPEIPVQGSVGASGDLAPLAHMAAAMLGMGSVVGPTGRRPAAEALASAGLTPLVLAPKEGLALLNGTQFSTAYALAGLFEADSLLRSALVTGAMSTDAGTRVGCALRRAHPFAAQASGPGQDGGGAAGAVAGQRDPRLPSRQ